MGSLQFYYRKRIRSKGVNFNHLLPHELVSNILYRVPITSLPQVKLTCKLWNSLIVNDPSFPSKHLSHAVENPGHLYTLFNYTDFYFAEKQLNNITTTTAIRLPRQVANDDLGEDTLATAKLKLAFWQSYASCYGLVCHFPFMSSSVHVFNPIIKEHVRLPDHPLPHVLRWGFGYAPTTHKYKCYCYSTAKQDGKTWVFSSAVYTLGDDQSWREMCCPPYPKILARKHVYSKGTLYWAIHNKLDNYLFPEVDCTEVPAILSVLSLDLETEKFRERRIDLDHGTRIIDLALVGETVATVASISDIIKVFFLLDEDKDIWEVKYTLAKRVWVDKQCFSCLELMGLWMNQELYFLQRVLHFRSGDMRFFFFSTSDNKFSPLHIPFPKDEQGKIKPLLILPHVGSLVSPVKIMTTGKQLLSNLCP